MERDTYEDWAFQQQLYPCDREIESREIFNSSLLSGAVEADTYRLFLRLARSLEVAFEEEDLVSGIRAVSMSCAAIERSTVLLCHCTVARETPMTYNCFLLSSFCYCVKSGSHARCWKKMENLVGSDVVGWTEG